MHSRGIHKVTFIANKDAIRALIEQGYPLKQIWQKIPALTTMSYPTFARYISTGVHDAMHARSDEERKPATASARAAGQSQCSPVVAPILHTADDDRLSMQSQTAPIKPQPPDRQPRRFIYDSNAGNTLIKTLLKDHK